MNYRDKLISDMTTDGALVGGIPRHEIGDAISNFELIAETIGQVVYISVVHDSACPVVEGRSGGLSACLCEHVQFFVSTRDMGKTRKRAQAVDR